MTVNPAAFVVAAVFVVGGALAAVGLRDLERAIQGLAASAVGVGVLLIAAGADLVGAVELLVGVVAVPLLLLSAVALTARRHPPETTAPALLPVAGVVAGVATAGLAVVLAASPGSWRAAPWPQQLADDGAAQTTARSLLTQGILPVMGLGVLLLVGIVVAVSLGRRDEREVALERAARQRREREERSRRRREDRERARGRLPAEEEAPT